MNQYWIDNQWKAHHRFLGISPVLVLKMNNINLSF